jgi:hypothetical protein
MKHRIVAPLLAAALLLVAHPSISNAQDVMFITVDFPFAVQGRTVPAGTYVLWLKPDMTGFTLTQSDTPPPAETIAFETERRLAPMEPPLGAAHVVFEQDRDHNFLSEIWLPGEDGWLVYQTQGSRAHRRVTVEIKHKR